MSRKLLTSLTEVAGFALIVAGIALISAVAGLIAGGIALVLIGWRTA